MHLVNVNLNFSLKWEKPIMEGLERSRKDLELPNFAHIDNPTL